MLVFNSSEYSIDSNEDEGQPLTQEELRQRAIKGVSIHYKNHYNYLLMDIAVPT